MDPHSAPPPDAPPAQIAPIDRRPDEAGCAAPEQASAAPGAQPGPGPRYVAHFTPEAWVNNQAIEVDPAGPREWDCTAYAMEDLAYLARLDAHGESLDSPQGAVDNDDVFKGDPAAPQWVRDWSGPFTIRITRQARTWNVVAPVVALIRAGTAAEAISTHRAQLTAAGFDVYDGEPGCHAFESEDTGPAA
jgi:hypothetical protein